MGNIAGKAYQPDPESVPTIHGQYKLKAKPNTVNLGQIWFSRTEAAKSQT